MKKLIIIILSLLIFSCGARKVEKTAEVVKTDFKETTKVKSDIDVSKKEETKKNIIVNDSTKEEIEETVIESIGKPKITLRKIKRFKAIKTLDNTNIVKDEKSNDKTIKITEKSKQKQTNTKNKTVDKKQFDFIGQLLTYWWLWLLIAIGIYLFKKYRDKIWFI